MKQIFYKVPIRFAGSTALPLVLCGLLGWLAALPATAQNAAFQNFFSQVCPTATGALSARADETSGTCDVSSDSESSLNPSQGLSSTDRLLSRVQSKNEETQDRMDRLRGPDAGFDDSSISAINPSGLSVYINGRGTGFDRDRNSSDNERGFDGDTLTLEAGIDRRLNSKTVIGTMLTIEETDVDFDADQPGVNFTPQNNDGQTESDTVSVALYGTRTLSENLFLDASTGLGFTDYTFRRNSVFQETTRTIDQVNSRTEGDTDGHDYWLSVGISRQIQRSALDTSIYGRVNYTRSTIDGYTEEDLTGSGLNMRFGDNTSKSLTSVLGISAGYAISKSWGGFIPQGRLEWVHEFEDDPQNFDAAFVLDAASNNLNVVGDRPDEDYFNIGLGVLFVLQNGWMTFFDYQGLLGYDDLDRNRFTFGLRKEL